MHNIQQHNMIDCYIVDDEPNNVHALIHVLNNNHPELNLLGYSINPLEAVDQLNNSKIDLLFLDIQMPKLNGFELLKKVNHRDFEVIFITAYDQYGIQAVKISALDYLLKPLNEMELATAITLAKAKVLAKQKNYNLENLLQNHNHATQDQKIALTINKDCRFVAIAEIIRCKADNNYTEIHLINDMKVIVSKTLKEFDLMLEGFGFLRCHHSHLVNVKYIKGIKGPGVHKILLSNAIEIPISRMKKELVKNLISKN